MSSTGPSLSRRGFLGAGAAAGALALAGALSGCSGGKLSGNPDELVLWYWARSMNPRYLQQSAKQIPGTDKRLRADLSGTASWDPKLRTTLAGRAYVPDIVLINSNVSLYFPDENLFIDLNKYSTAQDKANYYDWKWALGVPASGRHPFWPLDTGPTGFFYRADIFQKAGLPYQPTDVEESIKTWDAMFKVGQTLKAKANAFSFITAQMVFDQYVNASPTRYFDKNDHPTFSDQDSSIRQAWDTAVQAHKAGITANYQVAADQNAGFVSGKVAAHIEGAWWAQIIHDTAPTGTGKWRVTQPPVRPGNSGGSFICIPKTCKDPQAAFDFIRYNGTPDHQATTFNDIQLIPSTPGSFTSGIMRSPNNYFGSQNALDVFGANAGKISVSYISPYESGVQTAFDTEIVNVEAGGKNPDHAWNDAVSQANRVLSKVGIQT